jgi:hypothetical protein
LENKINIIEDAGKGLKINETWIGEKKEEENDKINKKKDEEKEEEKKEDINHEKNLGN